MDPPPLNCSNPETTMFNVHWDDFNRVVVDSLWSLLAEESLTDCTLVVSPCEQVQVHRVVLSANSPYFRSLLQAHSHHPNPIIILQDVSYSTLKMLVMFMYRGQVSVNSEEMTSLLRAAEHLQILGLTQTRRSPVNFGSSVVRPATTPSETAHPLSSSLCAESQSQVYSKKSRILEQNKATVTAPTQAATNNVNAIIQGQARDFRTEERRDAPLDPLQEQHSPLSLKKEEGSESNDWEDKHMDMEHASEQSTLCLRYCCPYCSTNFPSQSSLSRHIMVVHPTVYSSLYDTLPSTSAPPQPTNLVLDQPLSTSSVPSSPQDMNHVLEGHEELSDGNGIICKFCGKPFPEVGQLIQHLPIHTGERPFKCEYCGKAFKLRHHMKDHARVHTGERPFRCGLCGKNFSRSTILKAHEKTHFPKGSLPPSGPGSSGNGSGST